MALHEQSIGASDEWYTPPYVFEALGCHFDLDAASPGQAITPWIPADRFITEHSLETEWPGFTWLNAPFGGRNGLVPWLAKFEQYGDGVALVPDRTSAPWFQRYVLRSELVLIVARKIRFLLPNGQEGRSPAQGTCLYSFGPRGRAALERAARHGLGVLMLPNHTHTGPTIINRISARDGRTPVINAGDVVAGERSIMTKPTLTLATESESKLSIKKADEKFSLDKFKSTKAVALANVETMPTDLKIHKLAEAKDFIRLHPDEDNWWSPELCFVNVPIKGQKRDTLHLINEDLALEYLQPGRILRFRLALATKPYDVFFLAQIPTRNLDNEWNIATLKAAEQAKTLWVLLTSRKEEGVETYKIDYAANQDAFPPTKWLEKQTLNEMILSRFSGFSIELADHPGLLRLIGARQTTS
jgi:hypothetical protein